VNAMGKWCARYGVPKVLRSDGGSHFVNGVVKELCEKLGIRHEITAAYCSFSNGSVERVNREIKKLLNLLIVERRQSNEQWPMWISAVMSIINSTCTPRLGGSCARKVFLGFDATDPLTVLYDVELGLVDLPVESEVVKSVSQQLVDGFVDSYETVKQSYLKARDRRNEMYRKYFLTGKRRKKYDYDPRRREEWIQEEMDKLPVEMSVKDKRDAVNVMLLEGKFDVGDFVLVAFRMQKNQDKLVVRWRGPYRVVEVLNPRVCVVEHLVSKLRRQVHAVRTRFFANKYYEVTEEIMEVVANEANEDGFVEVDCLVDARYNEETLEWEMKVHWKGFEDEDDTWESLVELVDTIPDTVDQFVRAIGDIDKKVRLTQLLRELRAVVAQEEAEEESRKKTKKRKRS
jgi:hypothetical protein